MKRFLLFVDILSIYVVVWILPRVAVWLGGESGGWQVVYTAVVYIIFCASVYMIRKLISDGAAKGLPAWLYDPHVMGVLAASFGLLFAIVLLEMLGYWDSIFIVNDRVMGAGESSAFFAFGPGAFVAMALFYIVILAGDVDTAVAPENDRYLSTVLVSSLGINLMLVWLGVVFRVVFNQQADANQVVWGVGVFFALLLAVGPPRILGAMKGVSLPLVYYVVPVLLCTAVVVW